MTSPRYKAAFKGLVSLIGRFSPKRHPHLSIWYQIVIYAFVICFGLLYYLGDFPDTNMWISQSPFLYNHAYHEILLFCFVALVYTSAILLGTRKALIISIVGFIIVSPHAAYIPVYPDAFFRIVTWLLINILLALVIGAELKTRDQHQIYIRQLLNAQEEQRKRLSRDLHDGPVQSLVDIGHNIDQMLDDKADSSKSISDRLIKMRDKIDDILEQTRRAIHGLQPPLLEEVGLQPALMWLCDDLAERSDIKIDVDIHLPEQRISGELEITLFRIVQEALTNIKKHANASEVVVELKTNGRNIELLITDNGFGFEPLTSDKLYTLDKFGLIGIRKRVDLLGGTFNLQSVVEKGTTLLIEIPI